MERQFVRWIEFAEATLGDSFYPWVPTPRSYALLLGTSYH